MSTEPLDLDAIEDRHEACLDAGDVKGLLAEVRWLRERLTDTIDPADIPDQRAAGWPDWHPETYCHRCGRRNLWSWYVDSALWNVVHGGSGPIWCPVCFVAAYEDVTGHQQSWRLAPADLSDETGALIRSEAAMRHERDEARAEVRRLRETLRGLLAFYDATLGCATFDAGEELLVDGVRLFNVVSLIEEEESVRFDAALDAAEPHARRSRAGTASW